MELPRGRVQRHVAVDAREGQRVSVRREGGHVRARPAVRERGGDAGVGVGVGVRVRADQLAVHRARRHLTAHVVRWVEVVGRQRELAGRKAAPDTTPWAYWGWGRGRGHAAGREEGGLSLEVEAAHAVRHTRDSVVEHWRLARSGVLAADDAAVLRLAAVPESVGCDHAWGALALARGRVTRYLGEVHMRLLVKVPADGCVGGCGELRAVKLPIDIAVVEVRGSLSVRRVERVRVGRKRGRPRKVLRRRASSSRVVQGPHGIGRRWGQVRVLTLEVLEVGIPAGKLAATPSDLAAVWPLAGAEEVNTVSERLLLTECGGGEPENWSRRTPCYMSRSGEGARQCW